MVDYLDSTQKKFILEQVKKICSTDDFKPKSLLCRFLMFIIEETLAGRGDQLKGYTIGVGVLGKSENFDPEQDSLVRIHAGRLRRSLDLYYLREGKDDSIRIYIPKGSYQPQFLQNKASDSEENDSGQENANSSSFSTEPSVAILPFNNLTGDPTKDYIAQGFSEDLSVELTKYDDLRVINCWYRPEKDSVIKTVFYDELGVRFLVDGSILGVENELRILVKLLDTLSGDQIWAEKYVKKFSLTNLLAIEDDITDLIAKTIGSEVGVIFHHMSQESGRMKPEKLSVFDAILSFYHYEANISSANALQTVEKLKAALQEDPTSGIIHAMLASLMGNAYALDFPDNDKSFALMVDLAEKAIALEPDNHIVRIIFLFKCFLVDDKDRFFQEVEKCLQMKIASPGKLGIVGFHASLFGDWERGKSILDKAMNQNIGYPKYFHGARCLYHYRASRFEDALAEANKYNVPGLFWGPMLRVACLGQLGDHSEAVLQKEQLTTLKPDFEEKATYLISRFVKQEELVEMIIDGLLKAGMRLHSTK